MNPFDLSGKKMVVTGGTNGIGRGLVEYFLKQGVQVAAVGSREETTATLKEDMAVLGFKVSVYDADLRQVALIQPLFDRMDEEMGGMDILVNCAGMGNPMPALDVTQKDWDEMMGLNVRASFFCAQAAARHMLPRGKGRIINMSSQLSVVANENEAVYCASKGALNNLTRALSYEWSPKGVIVSAVAPTFTYTPGTAERLDNPDFRDGVLARIPRGRLGTLDDVGAAVQYLASDHADMASGVVLFIDGGWTIV